MWLSVLALCCLPHAPHTQDTGFGPGAEVRAWMLESAIPLQPESDGGLERFVERIADVRVIGLGEATHGQRESFAFKRRLTMHLIRHHGYRVVAYEASATGSQAANAYVMGESDDLNRAMNGFGMLIWMVQENRALLEDLRAWNAGAEPADRVEFLGIDVQDASGASEHLHDLLGDALPDLAQEAKLLGADLEAGRNEAYQGNTEAVEDARERLLRFCVKLFNQEGDLAIRTSETHAAEAMRCARELLRFPALPSEGGMRDRGMALSLLDALAARGEGTKAVLWAHNGHVTKGPLRYLGSEATGIGGYLQPALGDGYYALGFAYGGGDFQALDRDEDGKWWFRRYSHGPAPEGSLGATLFAAGLDDALLDFRQVPDTGKVSEWLRSSQRQRLWGGYGVPSDAGSVPKTSSALPITVLADDFDGLLFLKQTSSAEPVNQDRIWKD